LRNCTDTVGRSFRNVVVYQVEISGMVVFFVFVGAWGGV
jgi:hypothetical protein